MQDLKVTGLQATSTGLPRRTRLGPDSLFWLILVSVAFLAAELTPALLRMPLGADEITYIARTSAHASGVSLPPVHGQGAGLLAAPVTLLTDSLTAVRVWMSVLSAVGLFLSVLCWRGLRPMWVLALGELIFAGLAISQNSGVQVYPDWWGGLAVLALTGLFLHAVRGTMSNRVALPLIALVSLVIVLMRPQNIVFLMGPAILAALVVRRWRKLKVLIAMAVGIALGCLEWVAGAYIWYGGLSQRVQLAGQEPPAFRLYFSVGTQVKVLNGPWYCIPPGCRGWAVPAESPWWAAFLGIAILGFCIGWRRRSMRASTVLAGATALWVFALYSFLVPFGAPRYIIPSLALLAILAADGIAWAVTEGRWRKTAIAISCVFLASGLVTQRMILQHQVSLQRDTRNYYVQQADQLIKLGVRPPCAMLSPSIGYFVGCSAPWTGMSMPAYLARTSQGLKGWRLLQLPGLSMIVYVPAGSPLLKTQTTTVFRELLLPSSG